MGASPRVRSTAPQVPVHLGESAPQDHAGLLSTCGWGGGLHRSERYRRAVVATSGTEASRPGVSVGSTSEFSLFFRPVGLLHGGFPDVGADAGAVRCALPARRGV